MPRFRVSVTSSWPLAFSVATNPFDNPPVFELLISLIDAPTLASPPALVKMASPPALTVIVPATAAVRAAGTVPLPTA